jgi:ribosomal-protein-alanine N-acetyltransferase
MRLFSTERTDVYLLNQDLTEKLQQFLVTNRTNFAPFEPLRDDQYFTLNNISESIKQSVNEFNERKNLLMVFTMKEESEIVGSINFTNFVYGVFQACHLGFSIDHAHQGKGLMHETLKIAIDYLHEKYELHRVMANHLPDNHRSSNTLQSLGFMKEGYAKSYLKINGVWQDHVLNSLILSE